MPRCGLLLGYFLHSGPTPRGLEDSEALVSAACAESTSKLLHISNSDLNIILTCERHTDYQCVFGVGESSQVSEHHNVSAVVDRQSFPGFLVQEFRGSWPCGAEPQADALPTTSRLLHRGTIALDKMGNMPDYLCCVGANQIKLSRSVSIQWDWP